MSTWVRIWSSRCAPRGLQRVCCFLTMRLLITWLTADSTNEVEMIWVRLCCSDYAAARGMTLLA